MKIYSEIIERVFGNLSEEDIETVNRTIQRFDLMILDPLVQVHCQLALAAVVEEVRGLEVGTRTLTEDERERLKDLLGGP